ncbi:MAG: histidine kinase [Bryobacteraceae bacterium]|nr:histidine kinase [Bryobacteraceae bacterium]
MAHFLRQLLWLLLTGAVPPILMMVSTRRWTWPDVWQAYWTSAMFATLIGAPAGFVLPRLVVRSRNWASAWRIAAYGATLFVLANLGTMAGLWVLWFAGAVPERLFWQWTANAFRWSWFLTFCAGVVTYTYAHFRLQMEASNEKLRAKEREEQESRRLATEARLASLESRIHPHFLFNALNSVSSLIREDPVRAELLLERVSALLRFSLYEPHGGLVSLEQELKIVRDYLEIETVRFGPRLRYEVTCAAELDHVMVPPLSVQTLVENSVKYAITNRREGGEVRVSARRAGNEALVEVRDSGPGFDQISIPTGHGLDLLGARLDAQFSGAASLGYNRLPDGMSVTLRLPTAVAA